MHGVLFRYASKLGQRGINNGECEISAECCNFNLEMATHMKAVFSDMISGFFLASNVFTYSTQGKLNVGL